MTYTYDDDDDDDDDDEHEHIPRNYTYPKKLQSI